MQAIRVPGWRLSIADARYYGWRWCLQVGPWLVLLWPRQMRCAECDCKRGGRDCNWID
jgi:hypothetical protein